MDKFIARWVSPFYLKLLHANYTQLNGAELDEFVSSASRALREVDEAVVESLLRAGGWREFLTASWFAGLKGWRGFTDLIGKRLIESSVTYAGQGYCFAFGRFADERAARYLCAYLDEYLTRLNCYYDQAWAMAALIYIDENEGTTYSRKYLEPGGLWEQFVAGKRGWSLEMSVQEYRSAMAFCDRWFGDV